MNCIEQLDHRQETRSFCIDPVLAGRFNAPLAATNAMHWAAKYAGLSSVSQILQKL
jgi:hypothetical protein